MSNLYYNSICFISDDPIILNTLKENIMNNLLSNKTSLLDLLRVYNIKVDNLLNDENVIECFICECSLSIEYNDITDRFYFYVNCDSTNDNPIKLIDFFIDNSKLNISYFLKSLKDESVVIFNNDTYNLYFS